MVGPAYEIEELLHRNARTQAYRARDRDTGEKVIVDENIPVLAAGVEYGLPPLRRRATGTGSRG